MKYKVNYTVTKSVEVDSEDYDLDEGDTSEQIAQKVKDTEQQQAEEYLANAIADGECEIKLEVVAV